jgi:beta-mannosidase
MEYKYTGGFFYRIRLMTDQVRHMFTDIPRDLATYAKMSQISQAEAFKYFIERFRTAKWRRTGIIWWNLLDGWPQISDAVVNYDFTPKLAYHFIGRVQKPLHMAFSDPADGRFSLVGINDTSKDEVFTYTVKDITGLPVGTDLTTVPALLSGEATVPADTATPVASLPTTGMDDRFLLIEWTDSHGGHTSHFILEPKHLDYTTYMQALELCGFDDWHGF